MYNRILRSFPAMLIAGLLPGVIASAQEPPRTHALVMTTGATWEPELPEYGTGISFAAAMAFRTGKRIFTLLTVQYGSYVGTETTRPIDANSQRKSTQGRLHLRKPSRYEWGIGGAIHFDFGEGNQPGRLVPYLQLGMGAFDVGETTINTSGPSLYVQAWGPDIRSGLPFYASVALGARFRVSGAGSILLQAERRTGFMNYPKLTPIALQGGIWLDL